MSGRRQGVSHESCRWNLNDHEAIRVGLSATTSRPPCGARNPTVVRERNSRLQVKAGAMNVLSVQYEQDHQRHQDETCPDEHGDPRSPRHRPTRRRPRRRRVLRTRVRCCPAGLARAGLRKTRSGKGPLIGGYAEMRVRRSWHRSRAAVLSPRATARAQGRSGARPRRRRCQGQDASMRRMTTRCSSRAMTKVRKPVPAPYSAVHQCQAGS